jgi:ribonuclease VapC
MIAGFGFAIVPVTSTTAYRAGAIYARWGIGIHPAGLNFGDCFAYDVAKENACPLLFVGEDFAKMDVQRALV